jgi:hypothetical protein
MCINPQGRVCINQNAQKENGVIDMDFVCAAIILGN